MKDKVFQYVRERYGSDIEHLWERTPECAVFRRCDNKKWYGIVMDVPRDRFGFDDEGIVYVLNVKIDDVLFHDALLEREGYFPAYHMNKGTWISIFLDGSVPEDEITEMIDISYMAVAPKHKKKGNI